MEAVTNAVAGLLISWVAVRVLWPLFGWPVSGGQAWAVTAIFFALSFARSYVLRRLFRRAEEGASSPLRGCGRPSRQG